MNGVKRSALFVFCLAFHLRGECEDSNEEPLPYSFFVNAEEFFGDLKAFLEKRSISKESVLQIVYRPQAVFRVRALTRCTSTLPGHTDSVLSCAFSPDGSMLASGSGDKSVRLWDLNTQTPTATCLGHSGWVRREHWCDGLLSLMHTHQGSVHCVVSRCETFGFWVTR